MKKGLLLALFVLFGLSMNAQFSVGGGFAYMNDPGIEINSEFGISDGMITLSPSLDYYFPGNDVTSLAFNFEGHYNLGDTEALNYYPIAGLNYYYFSMDLPEYTDPYTGQKVGGNISDGQIGFDLGFGSSYALSDSMKLYGELKYVINDYADDLGFSFGILFNLGQ